MPPASAGFAYLSLPGWDLTAPAGTNDAPLEIVFGVHRDDIPDGFGRTVVVFRDGVAVRDCVGGRALPCVSQRRVKADTLELAVVTDHASVWALGIAEASAPACDGSERSSFTDVAAGNVHGPAIACATTLEVAKGATSRTYSPAAAVKRDQMASFLVRLLDAAGVSLRDGADAFDDDDGNVHEDAINRLAAAGLVNGVGARAYDPSASVSRAQVATFLVHVVEHAGGRQLPLAPDAFDDDDGNVHADAINTAAAAGIANGTGGGRYHPSRDVKRDQMASFLMRALDRLRRDGV